MLRIIVHVELPASAKQLSTSRNDGVAKNSFEYTFIHVLLENKYLRFAIVTYTSRDVE